MAPHPILANLSEVELHRLAAAFLSTPDFKVNNARAALLSGSATANSFQVMFGPTKKKILAAMSELKDENGDAFAEAPKATPKTPRKRKAAEDNEQTPTKSAKRGGKSAANAEIESPTKNTKRAKADTHVQPTKKEEAVKKEEPEQAALGGMSAEEATDFLLESAAEYAAEESINAANHGVKTTERS
ncbi:MAG: hypothetical protein M1828_002475 [Chrysothrix sp. TS-e1954]|nr:MAG: hypothetical protein M1828_002475 [Chrysothrix sp. TS-e1954]